MLTSKILHCERIILPGNKFFWFCSCKYIVNFIYYHIIILFAFYSLVNQQDNKNKLITQQFESNLLMPFAVFGYIYKLHALNFVIEI